MISGISFDSHISFLRFFYTLWPIQAIIDSQVAAIETLAKDSRAATDDLRKFEVRFH